jgi:hypothetical protein
MIKFSIEFWCINSFDSNGGIYFENHLIVGEKIKNKEQINQIEIDTVI